LEGLRPEVPWALTHVGVDSLGEGALFILSCTFLEEDLSKHIFFLLIGIVILNIVVARCIKHAVVVVVAIGVPVPDLLIDRLSRRLSLVPRDGKGSLACSSLSRYLTCKKQNPLMKAADDRNLNCLGFSSS
jgi:hypothetical protein